MSVLNLRNMLDRADATDLSEGKLAYARYHELMKAIAAKYDFPLPRVIAAFCSLSPNTDYVSNLRSLISVLEGLNGNKPRNLIKVSTYNHGRDRAIAYLDGHRDFLEKTKGPKVFNFYHNVLRPEDPAYVTIDGHMVGIWRDVRLTMKGLLIKRREYREIADAVKALAAEESLIPNQLQAILWFTRKRVLRIKYQPQMSLFGNPADLWKTSYDLSELKAYGT